jgi:hypothetical protein
MISRVGSGRTESRIRNVNINKTSIINIWALIAYCFEFRSLKHYFSGLVYWVPRYRIYSPRRDSVISSAYRQMKLRVQESSQQCCVSWSVGIRMFLGLLNPDTLVNSQRYGSRFFYQAKIVRKSWIPTVLLLFLTLSLKNDKNESSKSIKQKNFKNHKIFLASWRSVTKVVGSESGSISQRRGSVAVSTKAVAGMFCSDTDSDRGSVAFFTPGSGMGRKWRSGSLIRDEHPGSYVRELGKCFLV